MNEPSQSARKAISSWFHEPLRYRTSLGPAQPDQGQAESVRYAVSVAFAAKW